LEVIEGAVVGAPMIVGSDRDFRKTGFCAVFGVLRKGSGRLGEWKCLFLLSLHLMVWAQMRLRRQGGVAEICLLGGGRGGIRT